MPSPAENDAGAYDDDDDFISYGVSALCIILICSGLKFWPCACSIFESSYGYIYFTIEHWFWSCYSDIFPSNYFALFRFILPLLRLLLGNFFFYSSSYIYTILCFFY